MTQRHLLVGILTILVGGATARAQTTLADSLLGRGALDRAESAYYGAVRARPHDPVARFALGRYLAERGAPRVGATLMEEAIQFGGQPRVIAADLAPIYLEIGDYHGLTTLSAPALSPSAMARAQWFRSMAGTLGSVPLALAPVRVTGGEEPTWWEVYPA